MIAADASVVVEFLLRPRAPAAIELRGHIGQGQLIFAPHLLDAEVVQTLRRFSLRRELTVTRAREALDDLVRLPIRRFAHTRLLHRAFELRDNVTVYDGLYLALAEALDVPLLSCDSAMANVPGCTASVEILPVRDGEAVD